MKIYIAEDDTSIIGILEDIVEGSGLGTVCGDSGGGPVDLSQVLALEPDLVAVMIHWGVEYLGGEEPV